MVKNSSLIPLFNELKDILSKYSSNFNTVISDDGVYHLINKGRFMVEGREKKEIYFASILIQKSYVGLYYMPVYIEKEMKGMFSVNLLKLLKGKSCFHITKLDDKLGKDITKALEVGLQLYIKNGWI